MTQLFLVSVGLVIALLIVGVCVTIVIHLLVEEV